MKNGVTMAILGMLLLTAALPSTAGENDLAKKKILVLTFCEGYKHSALELCEQTLAKIGKDSGVFEADCLNMWKLKPEEIDLSFLTKEKMNEYDAIFFYTSSNKEAKDKDLLTEEQRAAFLEYVKSGHGFIGCHSASDTFYHWKEFGDILGGYFVNHPWALVMPLSPSRWRTRPIPPPRCSVTPGPSRMRSTSSRSLTPARNCMS